LIETYTKDGSRSGTVAKLNEEVIALRRENAMLLRQLENKEIDDDNPRTKNN